VFQSAASLAPLDVFVMMDVSGSMDAPTQANVQKWVAVRDALQAFFAEPDSGGIGVAISFFPIIDPSVPELCTDDTACGVPDACELVHLCMPLTGTPCESNADCTNNDTCEQLGYCVNAPNPSETYCVPSVGINCEGNTGPCTDYGYCENHFTCDAGPYATPAAGVVTLPGGGSTIVSALDAQLKEGATPTLPALTGALDGAIAWGEANPEHKVIVVLATDGLPTICDPALDSPDPSQAIDNLAQVASEGVVEGVQTFVIGVFAPEEQTQAQQNLDAIAFAGGSEQAYIITTSPTVTQQFLEALNEVRVIATSCEFALDLQSTEPVDYEDVWIRVSDKQTGTQTWVKRVSGESACDPQSGGFYYDVPPGGPVEPSRVILCPASCELLGASVDRTIEIFTTCPDDPTGDS